MKKYLLIIASCLASVVALGQSMYDAIAYGENNYYGTARSIALGNAVTALGGDLGAVSINPAAAAVANYSQFVITPGVSISSSSSSYAAEYGAGQYQGPYNSNRGRFILPNVGMNVNFYLPDGFFKTMSFAVVCNTTQQHLFFSEAAGTNNSTSMSGAMAYSANFNADGAGHMMEPDVFKSYGNEGAYTNTVYGWNELCAYQGNMISYDSKHKGYWGVAEAFDGSLLGPLRQTSQRQRTGTKNDLVASFAFNHEDNFYLGFSLGIPFQRYAYSEIFRETPEDNRQFPITFNTDKGEVTTCYTGSVYDYEYAANVDGIYGKVGFIWLPVTGLRVGASFQTPTAMTISETYRTAITSSFEDNRLSSTGASPCGEYRYRMVSPYRASLGLATTFGTAGLLSVDYEITDFSIMSYKEMGYNGSLLNGTFAVVNNVMRNFCGLAHQLRAGAEFNLGPCFAVRLGYTLKTSPECHYTNNRGDTVYASDYEMNYDRYVSRELTLANKTYDFSQAVHSASLGFGFASLGSFFADAVVRFNKYPESSFAPYAKYSNANEPDVRVRTNLFDAAVTFGWRF